MIITMKKYITLFVIALVYTNASAQVILGDQTKASTNTTAVLLDFEKDAARGVLLPTVSVLPTTVEDGTILLDAVSGTAARVKVRKNGAWFDLSTEDGNATLTRPTATDKTGTKAVIGAETSSADGVLVLESTTKAMVLPTVANTNLIINPSPGMMVYVRNTTNDKYLLALFNGTTWAYWAP